MSIESCVSDYSKPRINLSFSGIAQSLDCYECYSPEVYRWPSCRDPFQEDGPGMVKQRCEGQVCMVCTCEGQGCMVQRGEGQIFMVCRCEGQVCMVRRCEGQVCMVREGQVCMVRRCEGQVCMVHRCEGQVCMVRRCEGQVCMVRRCEGQVALTPLACRCERWVTECHDNSPSEVGNFKQLQDLYLLHCGHPHKVPSYGCNRSQGPFSRRTDGMDSITSTTL